MNFFVSFGIFFKGFAYVVYIRKAVKEDANYIRVLLTTVFVVSLPHSIFALVVARTIRIVQLRIHYRAKYAELTNANQIIPRGQSSGPTIGCVVQSSKYQTAAAPVSQQHRSQSGRSRNLN